MYYEWTPDTCIQETARSFHPNIWPTWACQDGKTSPGSWFEPTPVLKIKRSLMTGLNLPLSSLIHLLLSSDFQEQFACSSRRAARWSVSCRLWQHSGIEGEKNPTSVFRRKYKIWIDSWVKAAIIWGFFLFTFWSSSTVVGRLTNSAADFRLAFKWFTAVSNKVICRKKNTKRPVSRPKRHTLSHWWGGSPVHPALNPVSKWRHNSPFCSFPSGSTRVSWSLCPHSQSHPTFSLWFSDPRSVLVFPPTMPSGWIPLS